jgi:integrase/recombinase XerD
MKQARTLTDRQLKIVLAHCATRGHAARDKAIVMTSFLAGLRAKEIAALKLSDVRAADGSIRAEFVLSATQTKGRKTRRVFVSSKLRRELEAYVKTQKPSRRCDALFQSQKGRAFSANTMCQLFLNIYKACGIEGASSHSGRRSLLTNLAARGVGVRVLAEIAGHASISVTQRYLDVNDEQMRSAVELA